METTEQPVRLLPPSYGNNVLNTLVSIDCVIFGFSDNELKVLLIKSDHEIFKNRWALPGDLVHRSEDFEQAAHRMLREKTGLSPEYLEQLQAFSAVDRHPAMRVITVAFFSLLNIKDHQLRLCQNELRWHSVNEPCQLAFDHERILKTCIGKVRHQILETPIVFNLLPKKFSLREMQAIYEAVLQTRLDRRNFRKKIFLTNWLVDLDELEINVTHRPGKLYRFNGKAASSIF